VAERSFPRRGGPAAVDLVNTTIVERGRPHDLLASERDLAAWLAFERDRLDPETISTEISLADFHALREALRQTFTAVVRGRRPPAAALEAINRASLREPVAPQLDWSPAHRASSQRQPIRSPRSHAPRSSFSPGPAASDFAPAPTPSACSSSWPTNGGGCTARRAAVTASGSPGMPRAA